MKEFGPEGKKGNGHANDRDTHRDTHRDTNRNDRNVVHEARDKESVPELGHFAEQFAKDMASNLDRLARETGSPEFERAAREEREKYLDLIHPNNTGATEFHLLSQGGGGLRNDFAGLDIAWAAQSYVGSTTWKAQNGQTFCNVFVNSIGVQASLQMPTFGGLPATTQGWVANTGTLRCWKETSDVQRGTLFVVNDPNAQKGSTHHMGIVTDPETHKAVSAGSSKVNVYTSWEYDSTGKARYIEHARDRNDLTGRAEVHFHEYTCPDHRPFETKWRY
jgi:hypothetical protein